MMDWSGVDYLWTIVMFLIRTLILTAPIHFSNANCVFLLQESNHTFINNYLFNHIIIYNNHYSHLYIYYMTYELISHLYYIIIVIFSIVV